MDQRTPAEILVVDDDPALLNALKFSLQLDGFEVSGFDCAEALLARQEFPARGCIVADYRMLGLDGIEMVDRLRARGVHLPAILITTPTTAVRKRAAMANIPVVEKPLINNALVDKVRSLIDGDSEAA
jgi:two-component system response regulator FixJ